jgi:flagellar hook-basal body complex protein FliE
MALASIPDIAMRLPQTTELQPLQPTQPDVAPEIGTTDFGDVLAQAVGQANELGNVAQAKESDFALGLVDDLHGTMVAVKKAEISLQMVSTVRNKLLDAFHELWRTNV